MREALHCHFNENQPVNLEDLKKRATASELTLIEAVESALRKEMTMSVKVEAMNFIRANPPIIDRFENDARDRISSWLATLEKHLIPEKV